MQHWVLLYKHYSSNLIPLSLNTPLSPHHSPLSHHLHSHRFTRYLLIPFIYIFPFSPSLFLHSSGFPVLNFHHLCHFTCPHLTQYFLHPCPLRQLPWSPRCLTSYCPLHCLTSLHFFSSAILFVDFIIQLSCIMLIPHSLCLPVASAHFLYYLNFA